jgi:hypothetical protein
MNVNRSIDQDYIISKIKEQDAIFRKTRDELKEKDPIAERPTTPSTPRPVIEPFSPINSPSLTFLQRYFSDIKLTDEQMKRLEWVQSSCSTVMFSRWINSLQKFGDFKNDDAAKLFTRANIDGNQFTTLPEQKLLKALVRFLLLDLLLFLITCLTCWCFRIMSRVSTTLR